MNWSERPKASGPVWLVRFLPSFTDLAFLFPILFLFIHLNGTRTLLGDGDTGWHIRTGEWILQHHAVPKTDLFSFSKPGQPWFAWEWLWDVAAASIHAHWGLTGIVWVNAAFIGIVFVLLFRLVRRRTDNLVAGIVVTLLAMAASSLHWLARPHLCGWLLLLIFAALVETARAGHLRALLVLPIVTAVWTNVHATFFIGIGLLGAQAIGDTITVAFFPGEGDRAKLLRSARCFFFCAVGCLLATLLNPYGLELHRHVLTYLLDSRQLDNIAEYQSVSFHTPGAIYFETLLFLGILAVCWCWKRRRIADALVVGVWSHLALMSCRNIPIFAFFAAPVVAAMLQDTAARVAMGSSSGGVRRLARQIRDLGLDYREFEEYWRLHIPSVVAIVALAVMLSAPHRPGKFVSEYDSRMFPARAMAVLQSTPNARIFSDDQWGDYLIYKLYPQVQVFVDGRSDFYGAEFDERLVKLVNAHYDWESQLSHFGINTVLARADTPLVGVLKESRKWSLIFDDGIAVIFRSAPNGTELVAKQRSGEKLSSVTTDGKERAAVVQRRPDLPVVGSKPLERRS